MNDLELIQLMKTMEHTYELEKFSYRQSKAFSTMLAQVKKELFTQFDKLTDYQKSRTVTLLELTDQILAGFKTRIAGDMAKAAASASVGSAETHSNILGWNGEAAAVQSVTLSPEVMTEFWTKTPVGGRLMKDWVNSSFTYELKDRIQMEIGKGLYRGESYQKLMKRFDVGFQGIERHLDTLVKTYVHTANTDAMARVYKENRDVVSKVRWTAALEGGRGTGRGTCLICASLDGREYEVGHAPPCPVHPRCRCVLLAVLDQDQLGLSNDGYESVSRPYTIREEGVIGTGGKKIIDWGRFTGTFAEWAMGQPDNVLKNIVGPNRFTMLKAGEVEFDDLVDLRTKKVRTLAQLQARMN